MKPCIHKYAIEKEKLLFGYGLKCLNPKCTEDFFSPKENYHYIGMKTREGSMIYSLTNRNTT